jgi:hypothetical protein
MQDFRIEVFEVQMDVVVEFADAASVAAPIASVAVVLAAAAAPGRRSLALAAGLAATVAAERILKALLPGQRRPPGARRCGA